MPHRQQYQWMLGLAAAWLQKARLDDDNEPPGPRVEHVIGVAGRLSGVPSDSANDITAALFILLLIYVWNCAKHRANFGAFDQNRAKYLQINVVLFSYDYHPESRTTTPFTNSPAVFSCPHPPCQMNSPLTPG